MKKQPEEPKKKERPRPPEEGRREGIETYLAPPPPSKGRIIGLDCHPDTFTAAVFKGSTPHDARKISSHPDMSLKKLLDWAARDFTRDDLFLMEAGSNSFEIHRRPHRARLSGGKRPPVSGSPIRSLASAASCSTPTIKPLPTTLQPPTPSKGISTSSPSAPAAVDSASNAPMPRSSANATGLPFSVNC